MLPIWLSATQVRVIPVSHQHTGYADKIASKLESSCIRVDVDDKEETVQSKIRDAEIEWIPYIAVVGEKEIADKSVTFRVRKLGRVQKTSSINDFCKLVCDEIGDKPRLPLYLPKRLSMRPKFV